MQVTNHLQGVMLKRLRVRSTLCLIGMLLLVLSGCYRPLSTGTKNGTTPSADIDRLLDLMRQRLLVMHDVARWKWNAHVPVNDPAREQTILDAIVAQSKQHGLDPAFVRSFFVAQFEGAKGLQEEDFRRWEAEQRGPFADVPDLVSQLRPKIDHINGELLTALAAVRPLLDDMEVRGRVRQRAAAVLNGEGITEGIRDAAIGPLVNPRP